MKKNVFILVGIFILVLIAIYQNTQKKDTVAVSMGQGSDIHFMAPHFKLTGLDDQIYEFKGKHEKMLLINFWASWCGPCRQEAPDLVRFYQNYKDQIDLYAINITDSDSMPEIKKFVEEFQLPFPILLDQQGSISDIYNVVGIPTSFLVSPQGVIVDKFNVLSYKQLEQRVLTAIKK